MKEIVCHRILRLEAIDETTLHMGDLHGNFSSQCDALLSLEMKNEKPMFSDARQRPITQSG